eukprot:5031719-Amphidinium_carterae.1
MHQCIFIDELTWSYLLCEVVLCASVQIDSHRGGDYHGRRLRALRPSWCRQCIVKMQVTGPLASIVVTCAATSTAAQHVIAVHRIRKLCATPPGKKHSSKSLVSVLAKGASRSSQGRLGGHWNEL